MVNKYSIMGTIQEKIIKFLKIKEIYILLFIILINIMGYLPIFLFSIFDESIYLSPEDYAIHFFIIFINIILFMFIIRLYKYKKISEKNGWSLLNMIFPPSYYEKKIQYYYDGDINDTIKKILNKSGLKWEKNGNNIYEISLPWRYLATGEWMKIQINSSVIVLSSRNKGAIIPINLRNSNYRNVEKMIKNMKKENIKIQKLIDMKLRYRKYVY